MERLPDLPLLKIINFLKDENFQEIFKLRLINKHWSYCINKMNLKELILIDEENEFDNAEFPTYEPIGLNNLVLCRNVQNFFQDNGSTIKIFKNLEYLKVNCLIDLEQLNNFQKLKNLQIETNLNLTRDIYLNLPLLEILKFNRCDLREKTESDELSKLVIDSKNLKFLDCKIISHVKLKNPETLIHLEMNKFSQDVIAFKNLEILKYNQLFTKDTKISKLKLPSKLKEIYFFFIETIYRDTTQWKRMFKDILKQRKKALKDNRNLIFYFHNIEMTERYSFDELGFNYRDDFEYVFEYPFIYSNYEILSKNMPTLDYIDYWQFERDMNDLLIMPEMDNLSALLNNIKLVNAGEIVNFEFFAEFLSRCRVLKELMICKSTIDLTGEMLRFDLLLDLTDTEFSQEFFDNLVNYHLKKITLTVNEKSKFNFNFLLKFKLLQVFETNLEVQLDLILELLKNLKFLKELKFQNDKKKFIINIPKNEYQIIIETMEPMVFTVDNIGMLKNEFSKMIEKGIFKRDD